MFDRTFYSLNRCHREEHTQGYIGRWREGGRKGEPKEGNEEVSEREGERLSLGGEGLK